MSRANQEIQTSPVGMGSPMEGDSCGELTRSESVEFSAVADNWCCNCDEKHDNLKSCPYEKPHFIFSDSIIDFSSKDNTEER